MSQQGKTAPFVYPMFTPEIMMPSAVRLTAASVAKYKAGAKRREIADALGAGLYLNVQPSGAKSWALRFRRTDGSHAKLTLGPVDLSGEELKEAPVIGQPLTLSAARQLAAVVQRDRAMGVDVIEAQRSKRAHARAVAKDNAENSFPKCARQFFAEYRTKRGSRPRCWRDDAALLGLRYAVGADPATAEPELIKGSLADLWAGKPVATIDGHNIHTVVTVARKSGESRGRKTHATLSVLFGWLRQQRRVTANPCTDVWRPGPPAARERALTDDETRALWRACDTVGAPFGPMFKILLLSGVRLRKAAGMTRGELDGSVWTIPGARTKNHRPHLLPLPPLALEILAGVPVIDSEAGYIFTSTGRTPISGFSKAKKALDAAMGPVPPWRVHDIRRTTASGMAKIGIALPVVEKILNHVSGSFSGVAGIYQRHDFAEEKRDALARWASHVQGLVEDRPANVMPLRGGAS